MYDTKEYGIEGRYNALQTVLHCIRNICLIQYTIIYAEYFLYNGVPSAKHV